MRFWTSLLLQGLLALGVSAQDGASVRFSDWNLEDASQVRYGQLTMASPDSYLVALRGTSPALPLPVYRRLAVVGQGTISSDPALPPEGSGDGRFRLQPPPGGYHGAYFHVQPQDARGYQFCQWVRGQGRLQLKLADAAWQAREDGLVAAEVELTGEWQLVRAALPAGLEGQSLSSYTWLGQGQVELGAAGLVPQDQAAPAAPTRARSAPQSGHACWIWDTANRLGGPVDWMDFLRSRDVKVLFLQVPPQLDDRLAGLLEKLHRRGFEVQALSGDRHDVLPEARASVLEHLEQLFRFQQQSPARRFDGVHFDIEPYLLPGFGGQRRELILQRYLALVEVLVQRCHQQGLTAAFDIPCWYDSIRLEVGGVNQGLLEHIFSRCDEVAVMSYRTGADRVLESGASERLLAAQGNQRLWLGLETTPLPDEVTYTFEGIPRRGRAVSGEVAFVAGRFYLGPSNESGWCWKVTARENSPGNQLSFAHLPPERFRETRRQVQALVEVAIHDLRGWMELESK